MTTERGTLRGIGVGRQAIVGTALKWDPGAPADLIAEREKGDPASEFEVAKAAVLATSDELRILSGRQRGASRAILEAQVLMASDPEVLAEIQDRTEDGLSAEEAIIGAFGVFRDLLASAGEHMAGRVTDVDDLTRRSVARASGVEVPRVPRPAHPYVLIAPDLAPADTAWLNREEVVAFVTRDGGATSHTAILARVRGLPAIVGVADAMSIEDGTPLLVDALNGTITLNPDEAAVAAAEERQEEFAETSKHPGATADGFPVKLLANITSSRDIRRALEVGAEGVGLVRTEFLYQGRDTPPSIEEQLPVYTKVLEAFPGQPVSIRVLDSQADKPLKYLDREQVAEKNPQLGLRGLRALREHTDLLDDQLAALALAAKEHTGQMHVMAPMLTDADDASWFADRAHAAGLKSAGAMIEVPAAALTADQVLQHLDYAAVGTNDLAQFVLAADRTLAAVGTILDPWSPALVRLVELTIAAGHRVGKEVAVVGEAVSEPILACAFVGLGASALSMNARAIPEVRAALAETTMATCRHIANVIMSAGSAREARDKLGELALW